MTALLRELRAMVTQRNLLRLAGTAAAVAILIGLVLPQIHTSHTSSGSWQTPFPVVVLGAITGLTYGLLAVGLVLVYRSNRLINFAHGQIGAFGAAFFGIEAVRWHIPYWVALIPALALAAGTGAVAEVAVVRRLRNAPTIMSVVATLGVGQFLVLFAFAINNQAGAGTLFPQPPGMPSFRVGALLVTPAYSAMLILSPVVVIGLGVFLKLSRYGLAIRGAAANREAARMAGVFASRMSALAWAIAGAIAGLSAILTQPTQGELGADSFGPHLLLIALAGAVVARMQSLPVALLAGTGIGITEQLLLWNYEQSGVVDVALFVVILGALLLQRQRVGRTEEKGSWAAVQTPRPLPAAIRRAWAVRLGFPLATASAIAVLALLPLMIDDTTSVKLTSVFAFVVIGLSVTVVTGLGGQLSLGQFALAGVGAVASYEVARRTGSYLESFAYAGVIAAAVSVLIGIPALRVKGLLLTVTTLSFALMVPDFLLPQGFLLGDGGGKAPGQPTVLGKHLDTGRSYYYVGLVVMLLALLVVRNVRSSGLGRRLIAVRDNEDAARSFVIPAAVVKVQAFALAGFLAGVGGAMYAHSLPTITAGTFPTDSSIDVVKMAVIGGLGLVGGPILGAALIQGVAFLPLDAAGLAANAFGQLLLIMYLPSGLGSLVIPLRDRVARLLARLSGADLAAADAATERGFGDYASRELTQELPFRVRVQRKMPSGTPVLSAARLRKSFGGVQAVRDVSFEVMPGEVLGLIGPNGAGKTTTFELLAGFTRADAGTVSFAGQDVTAFGPEARGRRGLIRSFQDAALFPTMTVQECVMLALERVGPTRVLPALAGLRRAERRKEQAADRLIAWMGLERYRSAQIQELSTGTRRITELACLVALRPRVLLLDEPSSGIAQRETEALGNLLLRLKSELDLTLVVIEHDIPLIMGLSDRIVCMADGVVIAAGSPAEVRNDPAVVEAYLGGSLTAIERSDAALVGARNGRNP